MRTCTRIVDGFKFGFVYGDMNGADGLVIPTDVSTYRPSIEFMHALDKAQAMSNSFYDICYVSDFVDCNSRLEEIDLDILKDTLLQAKLAKEQEHWDINEFGTRTIKAIEWIIENIPLEIKRRSEPPKPFNIHKPKGGAKGTEGYVYVLQSPTGAYKIGRTRDPEDRLKTFTVKLPFEVQYTRVFFSPDMFKLEKYIHEQLADKRVNGEWFKLTAEDIANIERWAF